MPTLNQPVVEVRDEDAFLIDGECPDRRPPEVAHRMFTHPRRSRDTLARSCAPASFGVAAVGGEIVDDVHEWMAAAVLPGNGANR